MAGTKSKSPFGDFSSPNIMVRRRAGAKANAAPATPAPAPAAAPTPAAPDAPAPAQQRVDPFYNPQNLMDLANFKFGQDTSLADIAAKLTELGTQVAYSKAQNDHTAKLNSGTLNDESAARGIFQSSIRDGGLADIEGQRVANNNLLDTQMYNAQTAAATQRAILAEHATGFMGGMNQAAVQNADDINKNILPPDAPAPTTSAAAPAPAAPAAPKATSSSPQPTTSGAPPYQVQAGYDSAGNAGSWHIYPDGHKVFVRKPVTRFESNG